MQQQKLPFVCVFGIIWKGTILPTIYPRPVHHRIPNFKGANAAGEKVVAMETFKNAKTVKVNPDKLQEFVRCKALEENKVLLVPTPRLKNGLFNRIVPPFDGNTATLKKCATKEGITNHSTPVGLDHRVNIDLIVIGSVAVSTKGRVLFTDSYSSF